MLSLLLITFAAVAATPSTIVPAPARPAVREAAIRAHLALLADDLLEGRGTCQRGGDLTVKYLAAQLQALGLEPAAHDSYLQPVAVIATQLVAGESHLSFTNGRDGFEPALFDDVVYQSGDGSAERAIDAPVLFVGFGIDAPDERWDDFKGADCRGKLLVVMVNEPPPTPSEPGRFSGENLTLYGRWTYKLQEAARRGAAGILLIHTAASARYEWSVARRGYEGEKFQLADGPPQPPLVGWISESAAQRLATLAGMELAALQRAALSRDFRPRDLGLRAQGRRVSAVRHCTQDNVAAVLPGSDPALRDEVVLFSAHWDHFGVRDGRIYNGAVDNASACATLLALAQASSSAPTRRSQMYLFTFGEEQGLLGATAYVQRPLWPLARTVANLNLESLNWVGPSRDIEFLGGERSGLLELGSETARVLGLELRASEPDLDGLYFRSDHYPFAAAGIPALSPGFSLGGERAYVEDPEASLVRARGYRSRYHQEGDDYDPSWDLRGMVQQGQFILDLGRAIANAPTRPRPSAKPGGGQPGGR